MTEPSPADDPAPGPIGWYGKLPARGDFIGRGLPAPWRRVWDDWLQAGFAEAAETLGGAAALRARLGDFVPWRYAATAADGTGWRGIVVPSHDRVGRAYPLTLAEQVGPGDPGTLHADCLPGLLEAARRGPDELDEVLRRLRSASMHEPAPPGERLAPLALVEPADPLAGTSRWWPLSPGAAREPLVSTWPPEPALLSRLLGA